jgi:hypothetical protein
MEIPIVIRVAVIFIWFFFFHLEGRNHDWEEVQGWCRIVCVCVDSLFFAASLLISILSETIKSWSQAETASCALQHTNTVGRPKTRS